MSDYIKLSCVRIKRNSYSEVEREQKVLECQQDGLITILYFYIQAEELERIKSAIKKRKPDVIVVSAESRYMYTLCDTYTFTYILQCLLYTCTVDVTL